MNLYGLDNSSEKGKPLTEKQFLDAQIARSRADIARCVADIKTTVKHYANPRRLAAQHPWIVTGASAGMGAFLVRLIKTRGREPSVNGTKQTSSSTKVAHSLITSILPLLVKKWLAWKTPTSADQRASASDANSDAGAVA